jgi:hypothetical protein
MNWLLVAGSLKTNYAQPWQHGDGWTMSTQMSFWKNLFHGGQNHICRRWQEGSSGMTRRGLMIEPARHRSMASNEHPAASNI